MDSRWCCWCFNGAEFEGSLRCYRAWTKQKPPAIRIMGWSRSASTQQHRSCHFPAPSHNHTTNNQVSHVWTFFKIILFFLGLKFLPFHSKFSPFSIRPKLFFSLFCFYNFGNYVELPFFFLISFEQCFSHIHFYVLHILVNFYRLIFFHSF